MEEHPAEELLEAFALRRLPADQMLQILRHFEACESCRASLGFEYEFIDTIRAALREFEPGPTDCGPESSESPE